MIGGDKGRSYADVLNAERDTRSKDRCSFDEKIQLQRVDASQAKGLVPGEHVALRVRRQNNVDSVICVKNDSKKYLGSVAFAGVDRLIGCLNKGRKYNVTIDVIAGTAIQIQIIDA